MKIRILISIVILSCRIFAQTSDDQYKKPLTEVIKDLQERYDITIRYSEKLVADKWVTYAEWRYQPDIEKTLSSILSSVDLIYKKEGDKKYKIKNLEYYRISFEEGKEKTEYLASLYNDKASWEKRKQELKSCMWQALKLNEIPEWPESEPVKSNFRKLNGYSVENIALEILPGVYTFGSVYKPLKPEKKCPVILCPNGHWNEGRYRANHQIRCAMMARMGAITVSYDLFAWGESMLQFPYETHHKSLAMTIQVMNTLRFLDYLTTLKEADPEKVAIVGGSGAGSHSMLITALDNRIKVSVPTVMLSCYMYGGCPCESGIPVHLCGNGTNNVELSAMAAPRPQLIISDGKDWTDHVPDFEYPMVKRVYKFYNKEELVENAHFANEGHDFGPSKRMAVYPFIAKYLDLDLKKIKDKNGNIDESLVTIEKMEDMYVVGNKAENLPANAIRSYEELEKIFYLTTIK